MGWAINFFSMSHLLAATLTEEQRWLSYTYMEFYDSIRRYPRLYNLRVGFLTYRLNNARSAPIRIGSVLKIGEEDFRFEKSRDFRGNADQEDFCCSSGADRTCRAVESDHDRE